MAGRNQSSGQSGGWCREVAKGLPNPRQPIDRHFGVGGLTPTEGVTAADCRGKDDHYITTARPHSLRRGSMCQQNRDCRIIGLAPRGKFFEGVKDRVDELVCVPCLAFDSRFHKAVHSPFLA